MATADNSGYVTLEMLQAMSKQSIFRRTTIARPRSFASNHSDATEILDTDFESDCDRSYDDDSSRRSAGSLVADSVTTADTPRDVPTPDSGALSAFDFHFDEKPIMGPNGPHLFRTSMSSDEMNTSYEVDFMLAKTPTVAIFSPSVTEERRDTPLPGHENYFEPTAQAQELKSINAAVSALDESEVRSWSPPDVVRWMQESGFDDSVIEKFFINDISGAILLDLRSEDLKELDIQSFGKRRHVMNSIQHLRDSFMLPNNETQPHTITTSSSPECTSSSDSASTPTKDSTKKKHRRRRNHRSHKKYTVANDLNPDDSASLVAIEQFLPKPHRCSKGEDCRKWQKQQRKIARLAKDLPIDIDAARLMSEDYEDQPPPTSKSLPNMDPMPTPSIVASSDVLGPEQTPVFQISEETLNEIGPRDPQENVRQYLNFQHLSKLQPVTQIVSKSDLCSSPDVDSPDSTKTTTSLADNLRSLPKLTIPVNHHIVVPGTFSASLSAQRTVTPSILRRQPNFVTNSIDSTLHSARPQPTTYGSSVSPADYVGSPSDFYRSHDFYQQASPLSEVDVPVTAILSAGPIQRHVSQSVPPNMRFGHHLRVIPDPFVRPRSTKPETHRAGPSIQILDSVDEVKPTHDTIDVPVTAIPLGPIERTESQSVPPDMRFGHDFYVTVDPIRRPMSTKASNYRYPSMLNSALDRVDELGPIDTEEDFATTPRTNPRSANDVTHSGWMRKRKTTRMLRHEWEDHHFTLKGTRLAMYEDERASRRDSKAIEYIDVDDYAVACSSIPSSSKLTAAFKKTVLKRKSSAQDEAAFAFSLIPAPNGKTTGAERRNFFVSNGKSHHFAVKTRDERIDWMRELMLAKALKKGKDSGDSVHVNGHVF
ncbi:uncharacterized protein BHQ10_007369 [Talaromyces amestolkiae]|uniref:SAM and PH domain protein n=1 Tax=Talaromyces amestolkiae TaxID=1196081 RepID=A0A364L6B5_TALAM|nr:uncharacterized protein BHQ10_007369 [Talaromyces amestolkiae]RAO71357.1 hypothetical protein BHQ10_007369 [Talaromyces amestolkiae]